MCAVDIDKAYDAVHRGAMDIVFKHLGLHDVQGMQFLRRVLDAGPTVVTGAATLSAPFFTSRGIK